MAWYALASYSAGTERRVALILGSSDAPRIYDLETVSSQIDSSVPSVANLAAADGLLSALQEWHDEQDQFAEFVAAAAELASSGRIVEVPGGLDAVVCSAGLVRPGGIDATGPDDWRAMFEVNVLGVLNTVSAVVGSVSYTKRSSPSSPCSGASLGSGERAGMGGSVAPM